SKIAVAILTPDGAITSDRERSAVLTVNVAPERTRFSVLQNKAKMTFGSQAEDLSAGQEIEVNKQALAQGALQRQLITANPARTTGEAGSGAVPASGRVVNPPAQGNVTAASLLSTSVAQSLAIVFFR